MAVSQGGDPGKPPLVLLGFKAAVGGGGNITGPYNGYLFYWKTTQIHALDAIAATLWPFLGQEKRDQFLVASRLAGKATRLDSTAPRETADQTERAWAAGFFDGEGSVSVGGASATHPAYRQPSLEIPQSSDHGVPESLLRFQSVVGCGSIKGPHPPRNPWGRLPAYRWEVGGHRNVEVVTGLIWEWLGCVKRTHIEWALSLVHAGLIRGAHTSRRERDA